MKKRGNLTLIAIITIVVGVAAGLTFLAVGKAYANGSIALKTAAARDIALALNTICSYPQDMEFTYDINLQKFIVKISENTVKVYDKSFVGYTGKDVSGIDPKFSKYSFVCSQKLDFVLDSPKKIIFAKKDGKLAISKE